MFLVNRNGVNGIDQLNLCIINTDATKCTNKMNRNEIPSPTSCLCFAVPCLAAVHSSTLPVFSLILMTAICISQSAILSRSKQRYLFLY